MITYWLYIYCYIMKFMIYFQCNKGRIQKIMWLKLIRKLKWLTAVFSVTTSFFKVIKGSHFSSLQYLSQFVFVQLYIYQWKTLLNHFCILTRLRLGLQGPLSVLSDLSSFRHFFLSPFLLPLEFPPDLSVYTLFRHKFMICYNLSSSGVFIQLWFLQCQV